MKLFVLRQKPYHDKVLQNPDITSAYVEWFLQQQMLPIPYLHNHRVIESLHMENGIHTVNDTLGSISQHGSTSQVLDEEEKTRKQKITRLSSFLTALQQEEVHVIVPLQHMWVYGKISLNSPLHVMNTPWCFKNDMKLYQDDVNVNRCVTITLQEWRVIEEMKMFRLPPVSLQEVIKNKDRIVRCIS